MKSKRNNFRFIKFAKTDIDKRFSTRKQETRLAEDFCDLNNAKYVIIGIEESIGPRANKGNIGAEGAFNSFCEKFFSMQSNESLNAKDICVAGSIKYLGGSLENKDLNLLVDELDDLVYKTLSELLKNDQFPIVIGGGHNNAYPIIKTISKKNKSKIAVVNFDAHADYRPLEGRHSGNPFSYAYKDDFLIDYNVIGLQKRYNSQKTIDGLRKDGHFFRFYEDYLDSKFDFKADLKLLAEKTEKNDNVFGLELDLDSIAFMPSSAFSPSAFSLDEARIYIRTFSKLKNVSYLHLPEGAPVSKNDKIVVGKTLAFLVSDFLECHGNSKD